MTNVTINARIWLGLLLGACVLSETAWAQFDLSWHSIDGGGATLSTGGDFRLGGTIGQPDACDQISGGSFLLVGGFWSGAAVTPCDLLGDIDNDLDTDLQDLALLLASFGASIGDAAYLAAADINADGTITIQDLSFLLSDFGIACP